jgi:hypothetical protein
MIWWASTTKPVGSVTWAVPTGMDRQKTAPHRPQ